MDLLSRDLKSQDARSNHQCSRTKGVQAFHWTTEETCLDSQRLNSFRMSSDIPTSWVSNTTYNFPRGLLPIRDRVIPSKASLLAIIPPFGHVLGRVDPATSCCHLGFILEVHDFVPDLFQALHCASPSTPSFPPRACRYGKDYRESVHAFTTSVSGGIQTS